MGGTLKTQSFVISGSKLSIKYKIAEQKYHQFCSMVKFAEQNSDFALFPIQPSGEVKIRGFVQEISS
jgi:hypothetical protein